MALTYNIEWRDTATLTTTPVSGITTLYYDLTGLTANTGYEFRVQETDGTTTSAWSAWYGFTTKSAGQSITLVDLQLATQTEPVNVASNLNNNSIQVNQSTQADNSVLTSNQVTASLDSTQITNSDSAAVIVDLGVQNISVEQVTAAETVVINTDSITTINLVVSEQVSSTAVVDLTQLGNLSTLILEQSLGLELVSLSQGDVIAGIESESVTQTGTAGVITDLVSEVVTIDQLTRAEIVNLLDGTGLSVLTVEQDSGLTPGDVSIINNVAVVSSEQGTESESIRTGIVVLIGVAIAEQVTEAEIADVIGSAMMVNPRSLRVKRTTIGYTINRNTSSFKVTLKTT